MAGKIELEPDERKRLTRIRAKEISLVDDAANEEEFAVVKRQEKETKLEGGIETMSKDDEKKEIQETPPEGIEFQKGEETPVEFPEDAEVICLVEEKDAGEEGADEDVKKQGYGGPSGGKVSTAIKSAMQMVGKAMGMKDVSDDAKKELKSALDVLGKLKGVGYPAPAAKVKKDTAEEEDVEKAGAKMSKARKDALTNISSSLGKAVENLKTLMKDVFGEEIPASKSEDETPAEKPTDAAEVISQGVAKALKPFTDTMGKFQETVKGMGDRLERVESLKPSPQGIEGEETVEKKEAGLWDGTAVSGLGTPK